MYYDNTGSKATGPNKHETSKTMSPSKPTIFLKLIIEICHNERKLTNTLILIGSSKMLRETTQKVMSEWDQVQMTGLDVMFPST
jgi:hypothetical protein